MLLGRFPAGTPAEVDRAVGAAREAAAEGVMRSAPSGGLYYVHQFMREQSRTIVH
jgi:hypothetical protein